MGVGPAMRIDIPRRLMERLARLPRDQQFEWLAKCRPQDALLLDAAFEAWANDNQLQPGGDGWRVWLMMAGRGFGKTRAGAEWIHALALHGAKRIALVGASIDEARSVMVEGQSGLLSIARRQRVRVKWEPGLGRMTWPSGAMASLYSGDHPDGLRGPEHHFAWCDELAKWRRAEESWANLQMGLRLGSRPRALVTTTPRPMRLLERIRGDTWTVASRGKTGDNISLPGSFIDVMTATYGGSRLGRQELDGELMAEAEGSLFPRALLERCRIQLLPGAGRGPGAPKGAADAAHWTPAYAGELDRVVVGVDPPASVGGDACGIVVAGRSDGKLYVLADCSVAGASPERWAAAVARAAEDWGASHVVAEANQGGAMVESVLKAADAGLKVRLVHASRGKVARAEPVAIRFEAGRAFLAGIFPELEEELSGLQIGGGYEGQSRSPDRADAMVWALTELSETRSGVPRVRML
ncbi:terminase family protein [Sphingomonas sp. RB56-2]|uniref:Terminase family protein n=1 Tax=Sphingomonas brevis TaxID=2908206 RepID=A0ABT0S657_9SPHN|nr:terminase family protein [Sphingomonas brevis]MCL6739875.1 terminase family protein [Sphingomonas brevis]